MSLLGKAITEAQQEPKESHTVTWSRRNIFDPKTIKKSTTTTFKERFKLLFRPFEYSVDSEGDLTTVVKYKKIGNVAYILDVKHHTTPNPSERTNK